MTDNRERRQHSPGETPCRDDKHVWQLGVRNWQIDTSIGIITVREGSPDGFTNENGRHRNWVLYICFLCGAREALGE